MNLLPLALAVSGLLLTACDKRPTSMLLGTAESMPVEKTSIVSEHKSAEPIYLLMGQSNISNMPIAYISDPLARLIPPGGYVFQTAEGGTSLAQWQKGQPLYENALSVYRRHKHLGKIAGIFFWQGEAESAAGPQVEAETWAARFTQFVADIRQDTGEPNLRVVFMQVGLLNSYPYAQTVKQQQASISIPNVIMTTTAGYAPDPDGHHFFNNLPALAERMATAMATGK